MADDVGTRNDTTVGSGFSRKRSYQSFRESIGGSLKKINKKAKLDETVGSKGNESTFKYGNYNRYYGYRNENRQDDKRLTILKKEWFENKSVLDIGSNVGHVSLWIGKNFHPEKIKGVDIDCELVKAAKKNIVHYIDENYVSNLEQSFSNDDNNVTSEENKSDLVKQSEETDLLSDSEHLKATEVLDVSPTEEKEEIKDVSPAEEKDEIKDVSPAEEKDEIKVVLPAEENIQTEEVLPNEENIQTEEVLPNEENIETEVLPAEEKDEIKDVLPTEENSGKKDMLCPSHTKDVDNGTNDENDKDDYKKIKEMNKSLMGRLDKNKNAKLENVFPYNVSFILENYVPAGSQVLKYVKEEFHVILCLSVTKWVQLNFGDCGLKLMFQKIYKQLFPGGKLILEPQPYKSYKRRKNLTPTIRKHYDAMKLMPGQFIEYLLSSEVGFSHSEQVEITLHEKQGFQRPIYILTKE